MELICDIDSSSSLQNGNFDNHAVSSAVDITSTHCGGMALAATLVSNEREGPVARYNLRSGFHTSDLQIPVI
ncbi:hypothetical protein L1987_11352 [Smallanthus sonchifolius]|uniref:Uncharacterized protein n=1 Tax=Smallanthus sonchifolius TaxID=185202 RepID=A0ACB9JE64_9ASTR|nr:hypothetical protein L1987_11352 [Smallanthus sonchifolius]